MKFHFKIYNIHCVLPCAVRGTKHNAFSLVEVLTALAILALVSSSVLVVIDRCITSATDSALQMSAFEVARENMEALLSKSTIQEMSDFGISDRDPGIRWQTIVETFYEPVTARMWLRGVCSADYTDSKGQEQTVELTHWLTGLSSVELLQIMWQREEALLSEQLIETKEQAARYAGVDVKTIEQWLENGMFTTEEGFFVKSNLDLYRDNNGNPSMEDRERQVLTQDELKTLTFRQQGWRDEIDPQTGLTYGELEQMNLFEILEALESQR